MERLTRTERTGLIAAVVLVAAAIAAISAVKSRSASESKRTDDSSRTEIEAFIRQTEAFEADTIPEKKARQKKKSGNSGERRQETANPLSRKLPKES